VLPSIYWVEFHVSKDLLLRREDGEGTSGEGSHKEAEEHLEIISISNTNKSKHNGNHCRVVKLQNNKKQGGDN